MKPDIVEAKHQYVKYLKWNQLLLKACGLWPRKKGWSKAKCFLYEFNTVFNFLWLISMTISETIAVITEWGNVLVITRVATTLTMCWVLIQKVLVLLWKRKQVTELDRITRKLWIKNWTRATKEGRERMIIAVAKLRTFTLIYVIVGTLIDLTFSITPIEVLLRQEAKNVPVDERKYPLPYSAFLPTVDLSVMSNYILGYIYSAGISIGVVCYTAGTDVFYAAYIAHVCLHFKLLGQQIRETVARQVNLRLCSKGRSSLKDCIENHQMLIRASEILNELFSQIMLVICIVSTVDLCVVTFQIVTSTDISSIASFGTYLGFLLTEVFIFCWFGNILTDEAVTISKAVYDSNWYDANDALKIDLLIIMRRAQKPIYITVGGFSIISLALYTWILRTTLSYFTLLRRIYGR